MRTNNTCGSEATLHSTVIDREQDFKHTSALDSSLQWYVDVAVNSGITGALAVTRREAVESEPSQASVAMNVFGRHQVCPCNTLANDAASPTKFYCDDAVVLHRFVDQVVMLHVSPVIC